MSKGTQDKLGHLKKERNKLRRLMCEYYHLRMGESEELVQMFWIILKSKQKLNVFVSRGPHGSVAYTLWRREKRCKKKKTTFEFKDEGPCIRVIIFGGLWHLMD